jgi:hypothetical protein
MDYRSPEFREACRTNIRESRARTAYSAPEAFEDLARFEDAFIEYLIVMSELKDEGRAKMEKHLPSKEDAPAVMVPIEAFHDLLAPMAMCITEMVISTGINVVGPMPVGIVYMLQMVNTVAAQGLQDMVTAGSFERMTQRAENDEQGILTEVPICPTHPAPTTKQ